MCGQMQSDAVSLTAHDALTSTYIHNQARYSNVCAVRDEEAAGSNPATPTQAKGHSPQWDVAFFYAVQQQSTVTPRDATASPRCLTRH
jgi:hypothetical protein